MTLLTGSTGTLLRSNRLPGAGVDAFAKDAGNPIISQGAGGSWEENEINGIDVFADRLLGGFVASYGGFNNADLGRIGIAYAAVPDGPWTKEVANPVFTPPSESAVASSIVQRDDDSYLMYWQKYPTNAIYLLSSSDLITWTALNGGSPVLSPGVVSWAADAVFDPCARLMPDGDIELFFAGQKLGPTERRIGHATAPADGFPLTVQGILLAPHASEEQDGFGAVHVIGNQEEYALYHDAEVTSGVRYINRQWTVDGGASFTREGQVLVKSASGWDSGQVFDPSPVLFEGIEYLIYCGGDVPGVALDLNAKVGVATRPWPQSRLAGA